MSLGPAASFLSEVIEPPPPKAVTASLQALADVGAVTLGGPDAPVPAATLPAAADAPGMAGAGDVAGGGGAAEAAGGAAEALTPLGRHLALLPLEPRLGKLLVMGACLGCLAPALVRRALGCVLLRARSLLVGAGASALCLSKQADASRLTPAPAPSPGHRPSRPR
jgi:HrpA-like RNA helicase